MTNFNYTSIPACATELDGGSGASKRPTISIATPSWVQPQAEQSGSPVGNGPASPAKQSFTNALISSALQLPNLPETPAGGDARLLSNRESLSIPTTTVNFRRFVAKSGPVFWLQDRIEEIVMWRKGWKVTCAWMAIYSFLCYFPKMFLLLPHFILISILLATHDISKPLAIGPTDPNKPAFEIPLPKEGSADWFANLQGIQNLMGLVSDGYDTAVQLVPLLTWQSPYTHNVLTVAVMSMLLLLPVVIFIPMRPVLLFLGLGPVILCHPRILQIIPVILEGPVRTWQPTVQKLIDDDNLLEQHWKAEKQEVELWEYERWTLAIGWSKGALKVGEKPWKGGGDDWMEVVKSDTASTTVSLPAEHNFIETEDWRLDIHGTFESCGAGNNGWVYTDNAWQNPHRAPLDAWKAQGAATRRRRWVRRLYRVQTS